MTAPAHPVSVDLTEGDSNLSAGRRAWLPRLDERTRQILVDDARSFLHQSLSTPCLDVLAYCEGSHITDISGRRILDFHGNGAHPVGYGHPAVISAVIDQLQRLSFCPRRYTNETAVALARRLGQIAPGNLSKVLLAPGGTSAVGMALKLARAATGRFKTLSMWDSFHGASLDAIGVGGEALFRRGMEPLLPGAIHVPPPVPDGCLWNPTGDCARCDLRCARHVEYVLDREGDVGAVIAEPIRCTDPQPAPPGYWRRVREACDRHGALLIFDETAVGLGRTGRLFACQHEDVTPDILLVGKGLGGGVMPLAAMIARADLDIAPHMALSHYTHEKNPVACAAALATLDLIQSGDLAGRADRLGRWAMARLKALQPQHRLVKAVRGRGLAIGVALSHKDKPAVEEADRLLYACLGRGLSFKVTGGHVINWTPPLTISETELAQAMAIFQAGLAEIETRLGP
ncbi:MAG: aspartate aminotransferase family protein [Desulfosarcinaceae bacterium]